MDGDDDGWPDWVDGCPEVPNPEQEDLNGNAIQDACEPGLDYDSDGVLNEDRPDYVKSPSELVLIDGVAAAVARLNAAGSRVVVVTNQSAVGRGIIDLATLDEVFVVGDLIAPIALGEIQCLVSAVQHDRWIVV